MPMTCRLSKSFARWQPADGLLASPPHPAGHEAPGGPAHGATAARRALPGAEDVLRAAGGDVEGAAVQRPGAQAPCAALRLDVAAQGAAESLKRLEVSGVGQAAWSLRACFTQAA